MSTASVWYEIKEHGRSFGIVEEESVPGCMLEAGDARVLGLCLANQGSAAQRRQPIAATARSSSKHA